MRIRRHSSSLPPSRLRRLRGILPFVMLMGLMASLAYLFRDKITLFFLSNLPVEQATLSDAQLAFAQGDLTQAIRITESLYQTQPTDTRPLRLLVRSLIYRSYSDFQHETDRSRALELTTQAQLLLSPTAETLAIHALALQVNGRSEEAVRVALRAIDRDKENIVARLALSLAYSDSGLFEAGLREADRAIGITKTSASDWQWDALRVKALALSDLGRYQDALDTAELAISANRRLWIAHFEKALYALQMGQYDTATNAYFTVIALDPNNIKARFRLCELSNHIRETDSAVRYCGEVTQRRADFADGWYYLGKQYFLLGRFREAQQAFNRCSTLQVAQNVPIIDRRFECWYLQGQSAEIVGDCPQLTAIYNEFRVMSRLAELPQTWVYPPEGATICLTPTPNSQ